MPKTKYCQPKPVKKVRYETLKEELGDLAYSEDYLRKLRTKPLEGMTQPLLLKGVHWFKGKGKTAIVFYDLEKTVSTISLFRTGELEAAS